MKTKEKIKKDIVDQLFWDNRVNANNVKVKVENEKAILTGSVLTYSEKVAAAKVAWSVIGVSGVENKLEVKFPTAFTVPSDDEIRRSVEQRLGWNTDVDSTDVVVDVKAGMVTLSGSVASFWQKISAETEAEKASGVISITNKLAVVPTEKIADEIIGERIMERVDENTSADVDKVDVKVKNGEVTLSGQVLTWDAWRAVYDAAQYTNGVTQIEDMLNIKYA